MIGYGVAQDEIDWAAVRDALDLPQDDDPVWARVKHYDLVALHMEAFKFFRQIPSWVDPDILRLCPTTIQPRALEWKQGKGTFLERARRLNILS